MSKPKLINNKRIALHLYNRIIKAYNAKQKFRVYIVIPLLPGFCGLVEESITVQLILKYTYKTLCRNKGNSLIEKLKATLGDSIDDYIGIYSLRTHGVLNGKPVTEQIYIHSKLMIVDDKKVLIGSANINDRSLRGKRDSEVAVVIEDSNPVCSKMNGEFYSASEFAYSLRSSLWQEHLGIDKTQVDLLEDPLSDNIISIFESRAKSNTMLYRRIFNCAPDDRIRTFSDLLLNDCTRTQATNLEELYNSNKGHILGNIVEFPRDFLKDQSLNRSYFCKEILVPLKSFL